MKRFWELAAALSFFVGVLETQFVVGSLLDFRFPSTELPLTFNRRFGLQVKRCVVRLGYYTDALGDIQGDGLYSDEQYVLEFGAKGLTERSEYDMLSKYNQSNSDAFFTVTVNKTFLSERTIFAVTAKPNMDAFKKRKSWLKYQSVPNLFISLEYNSKTRIVTLLEHKNDYQRVHGLRHGAFGLIYSHRLYCGPLKVAFSTKDVFKAPVYGRNGSFWWFPWHAANNKVLHCGANNEQVSKITLKDENTLIASSMNPEYRGNDNYGYTQVLSKESNEQMYFRFRPLDNPKSAVVLSNVFCYVYHVKQLKEYSVVEIHEPYDFNGDLNISEYTFSYANGFLKVFLPGGTSMEPLVKCNTKKNTATYYPDLPPHDDFGGATGFPEYSTKFLAHNVPQSHFFEESVVIEKNSFQRSAGYILVEHNVISFARGSGDLEASYAEKNPVELDDDISKPRSRRAINDYNIFFEPSVLAPFFKLKSGDKLTYYSTHMYEYDLRTSMFKIFQIKCKDNRDIVYSSILDTVTCGIIPNEIAPGQRQYEAIPWTLRNISNEPIEVSLRDPETFVKRFLISGVPLYRDFQCRMHVTASFHEHTMNEKCTIESIDLPQTGPMLTIVSKNRSFSFDSDGGGLITVDFTTCKVKTSKEDICEDYSSLHEDGWVDCVGSVVTTWRGNVRYIALRFRNSHRSNKDTHFVLLAECYTFQINSYGAKGAIDESKIASA